MFPSIRGLRPMFLLRVFLPWYFLRMPFRIVRGYGAYVRAIAAAFAFLFLLKTLVSPWKAIHDPYPQKGLNLGKIAETLALNLTARGVGCVVRIGAIVIGICFEGVALLLFGAALIGWILLPVILAMLAFFLTRQL